MKRRWQISKETWNSRNDTVVTSLGFLYLIYFKDLGDERASNLEMTMGADNKDPGLFNQRTRKGADWQHRELLGNGNSSL